MWSASGLESGKTTVRDGLPNDLAFRFQKRLREGESSTVSTLLETAEATCCPARGLTILVVLRRGRMSNPKNGVGELLFI